MIQKCTKSLEEEGSIERNNPCYSKPYIFRNLWISKFIRRTHFKGSETLKWLNIIIVNISKWTNLNWRLIMQVSNLLRCSFKRFSCKFTMNRVLIGFGMSRYQGKENFKLYLLHPFYFFLSVINPDPIRYNG